MTFNFFDWQTPSDKLTGNILMGLYYNNITKTFQNYSYAMGWFIVENNKESYDSQSSRITLLESWQTTITGTSTQIWAAITGHTAKIDNQETRITNLENNAGNSNGNASFIIFPNATGTISLYIEKGGYASYSGKLTVFETPEINITYPPDGLIVNKSNITVIGTARHSTGIANVTVNGISANGTTNWSANISLTIGVNTIRAAAIDNIGNTAIQTINITYFSNLKGDLNGNNKIDIGDAAMVASMVIGKIPPNPAADFNKNNRIDIGDASKIAYYLVGKVQEL